MIQIFTTLAAIFAIFEGYVFVKTEEISDKIELLKSDKESDPDSPIINSIRIFYSLWCFAGLFTQEWKLFLGLIILSIVTPIFCLKFSKLSRWFIRFDSIISIIFLTLIFLCLIDF
jgi:hypothetical protein